MAQDRYEKTDIKEVKFKDGKIEIEFNRKIQINEKQLLTRLKIFKDQKELIEKEIEKIEEIFKQAKIKLE